MAAPNSLFSWLFSRYVHVKALLSEESIADVRTNIERVVTEVLPGLPQSQQ
jgi:hypothetical protein